MSFDSTIHPEQHQYIDELFLHWDELANFGPSGISHGLRHCMQTLCRLTGADDAFWFGLVCHEPTANPARGKRSGAYFDMGVKPHSKTDELNGWRVGAMERLIPETVEYKSERYQAILNLADPTGDITRALVAQVGRFRVHQLLSGQLVDLEAFKQTQHYDFFYRQNNINDRLWVVFPVTPTSESCFVIDKIGSGRLFVEDEIRTAGHYLRGIKWFHRQALTCHGLGVMPVSLTPKEHRVLCCLLAGCSEKEIATELGITPGSAHQYCVNIYSKYGVRSRAKLMSLWLRSSEN